MKITKEVQHSMNQKSFDIMNKARHPWMQFSFLIFLKIFMTVEEQTQNLNQFKCILDSLPISRAALKKSESVINSVEANVPTLEHENVAVCVKDENLIIDLNDTLAEVVNNNCADKDQEVPAAKSSRILNSTSPVSLLLEFSQRIQDGPAIIWD